MSKPEPSYSKRCMADLYSLGEVKLDTSTFRDADRFREGTPFPKSRSIDLHLTLQPLPDAVEFMVEFTDTTRVEHADGWIILHDVRLRPAT